MDDICPSVIIRAVACVKDGFNPNVIPLLLSPSTANLQRIVCNIQQPVLLRLLVCREETKSHNPDNCAYPEHKNIVASKRACCDSQEKLAQLYVRDECTDINARSYILVFIAGHYLSNIDALLHLLKNTVDWLHIAQEKPYLYVFYYGHPETGVAASYAIKKLNKKIKETFPAYAKDEDACIGVSVVRKSESLHINQTTGNFSFSAG